MPRSLTSASKPGQELKNFTNREAERAVLSRLLDLPAGTLLPVVMFYGVGGAGKSWLMRRLRGELPDDMPSALLDLERRTGGTAYHTDSSRALAEQRRQFAVECPQFDLAYAWLRAKEGIKDDPLFRGSGVAGNVAEFVTEAANSLMQDVPGGNLVTWLGKKLSGGVWSKLTNSRLAEWLRTKFGEEDFLALRRMFPQEIYPQLADRFLRDLADQLPKRLGKACRGVLFLDTLEALRGGNQSDAVAHEREHWVRQLHATESPVLLVLAGRDRLRWEEVDPEYGRTECLEQHLVGGLSWTDARLFLTRCGITGGSVQEAVLRVCLDTETAATDQDPGYHAFSLGMCADTIVNEKAAGKTVDPASFDMTPGDTAQLAQRFLKSLADPAHEIWVKRLALTPRFDEAAARHAHSAVRSVQQDADWKTLTGYSFFGRTDEPGWWTLHLRMRDALTNLATDAAIGHEFWRDCWQQRAQTDTDDAAALAWYHSFRIDPDAAHRMWNSLAQSLRQGRRMADHYAILAWWEQTGSQEVAGVDSRTAGYLKSLGNEFAEATIGNRAENLRRAIACYEAALRVYTEAAFPTQWAMTQNNLGNAHQSLPGGDRAENLRRAIACYEAALRVNTEAAFPTQWATTQNNLGNAHLRLPGRDRAENLRRAIAYYEAALRVRTEANFPAQWATTQNYLGNAHQSLPGGDRAENLRRAIACYKAALRVNTEAAFPIQWATTQNSLGNAHADLPGGDRRENLRRAIACYEAALRVCIEAAFPADWAMIQNNLGNAHANLPGGDRAESLRRAIVCYEAALRVYTEAAFAADWAMTQKNKGLALRDIGHLTKENAVFQQSMACFEAAGRGYLSVGLIEEAQRVRYLAQGLATDVLVSKLPLRTQ